MIPELSYAEYVWSSYAIAAAVIVWQAVQPIHKYRQIVSQIKEDHLMRSEEHT